MSRIRFRAVRGTAILLGAILPVGLLCVAGSAQEQRRPETEPFKNVKLLKNLSHEQLIARMRVYNASLGVGCTFCHVRNEDHTGWDLDTKPEKQVARQMIRMTEDLNRRQRSLDGKATCFMCHHGQHEPQTRPEGGGDPDGRGR